MVLPNAGDIQKSVRRLTDYYTVPVPLGGATLAAQDYLGNTGGDEGVPLPEGTLQEVHVTLSAADDGNTSVQVENETTGDTASFSLEADTFTAETGIGLYFSEGDQLSVTVTAVTTPGDGLSAYVVHEVTPAPMN